MALPDDLAVLTPEDEAVLRRYAQSGMESLRAEEVEIVMVLATDTTIDLHGQKFDKREMDAVVERVPGLPFLLDHSWLSVEKVVGMFYKSARVMVSADAPFVDAIGMKDENLKWAEKDGGLWGCLAWAAVPSESPLLERIRFGARDISIGGFYISHLECPKTGLPFFHEDCRSVPVSPSVRGYALERERREWAEFGYEVVRAATMRGLYSLNEISLVTAGANTSACVVSDEMKQYLTIA